MASRIQDLVEGATISETSEDGFKATRVFLITGVTGSGPGRQLTAMHSAPPIGAAHPVIPLLFCKTKRAEIVNNSPGQYKVTCEYEPGNDTPEEEITATLGGTVQSVQTTKDAAGNTIELGPVTIQTTNEAGDAVTLKYPKQTGLVSKQVPQAIFTYKRREEAAPTAAIQRYLGKVNSAQYLGLNPGKVFCSRINGDTDDSGETYLVTYDFQIDFNGWEADVVYEDSGTGLPLVGATVANNGIKTVEIYEKVDFNELQLVRTV